MLCFAEEDLNVRTDFGTLTFEDNENISNEKQNDRIKDLRHLKLRAEENGYGEKFDESILVYVVISGVALLLLAILLFVIRRNKKIKKIKENN